MLLSVSSAVVVVVEVSVAAVELYISSSEIPSKKSCKDLRSGPVNRALQSPLSLL